MADEKIPSISIPAPTTPLSSTSPAPPSGGLFSRFRSVYNAFQERREALGLSNPGTVDNVAKEVQRDVFVTNSMFTGLRADITKAFSVAPMFHTSHAFSLGSQALAPYTFLSTYGTPKLFLQATLDNDLSLAARFNYRHTPSLVTRLQAQLAPPSPPGGGGNPLTGGSMPAQSMLQIDTDYTGADFSASLKALNPSVLDGGATGILIASYLQAVTPSLALGTEAMFQRPALAAGPETAVSLAARYRGADWIASAQVHGGGSALSASYWRRLGDRVEAAAELRVQPAEQALMHRQVRREGVATVGAKYDFRMASLRAQGDSSGKLSVAVEKRVLQAIQFVFAGEVEMLKQQAKVGLGVSIEISNEDIMEQQEKALNSNEPPPPY